MSKIKSYSVGNGDMFYIKHNTSNFTIIDCFLGDDNKERIVEELKTESSDKEITRFISTHPDEDHFQGLKYLDQKLGIVNFYCVKNDAIKNDESEHFDHYCLLRDSEKVFHLERGCRRKWMNESGDGRDHAGINILWPICGNKHYTEALNEAEVGGSPNNISPIIQYHTGEVSVVWMGDLESDFMEKIKNEVEWPKTAILFAPHHGRHTGKIPEDVLIMMNPKIIVIGEAPAEHLNYYSGYNTITQNRAGDISFDCKETKVHISVSDWNYDVDFLDWENVEYEDNYIGTLNI